MNPPEPCIRGHSTVEVAARNALHFYGRGDLTTGSMSWRPKEKVWSVRIYAIGLSSCVGEMVINSWGEIIQKTPQDLLEENIRRGHES